MLAKHRGMSVPAALDGLMICLCATWTFVTLNVLMCYIWLWSSNTLRDDNKGYTCRKKKKDKNGVPGWLEKHREIWGFVLNYKTVKRVTKCDV